MNRLCKKCDSRYVEDGDLCEHCMSQEQQKKLSDADDLSSDGSESERLEMGRVAYTGLIIGLLVIASVIVWSLHPLPMRMTHLQFLVFVGLFPTQMGHIPSQPPIILLNVVLSIVLCYLSIARSKNAGGRGKVLAYLMLLYWFFPPVWLGSIYLMCAKER